MLEREKTLVSHTEEPPQGYKHLELLLRLSHPERIKTSSRSHSVAIFGTHVEAMERPWTSLVGHARNAGWYFSPKPMRTQASNKDPNAGKSSDIPENRRPFWWGWQEILVKVKEGREAKLAVGPVEGDVVGLEGQRGKWLKRKSCGGEVVLST
jgi:hypothetical protein